MKYKTAAAFRQALEGRLRAASQELKAPLVRLRKMVCFERLVARIQSRDGGRWLLKGGFALQLRLGRRSRTTKDVDLGANLAVIGETPLSPDSIQAELAQAAGRDLQDFFEYRVGPSAVLDVIAGPVRAYRFPVVALMAAREFEVFHADTGVGDPVAAPAVELRSSGLLDFAELPPASFHAIAPIQHLAEKIHAITRKWEKSENSRMRDLVDAMLLLELDLPDATVVREVVRAIFRTRSTHEIPAMVADPPESWRAEYARLAAELELGQRNIEEAMARLRAFWEGLEWQEKLERQ